MFKRFLLKFLLFLPLVFLLLPSHSFAGAITIGGTSEIQKVSLNNGSSSDIVSTIENTGFSLLRTIKIILIGLFVIYMVYAGAKMIMSMGTDEDKIKSAKKQIWYALIGIIFVNIPGTIYEAFYKPSNGSIGGSIGSSWNSKTQSFADTIFINGSAFDYLINSVVWMLEVVIFWGAIFILVYSGIKLILGGKDTKIVQESKMKLLYSIMALILVGFIEAWKNFAFGGQIASGISLFKTLANLILFLAAPIAIFYLSLAGYYYITSGGNDEKIKKAKNIITYVLLGGLIFLASYTFLLELGTFNS
nr:hypothetical protein [Candidatus Gracilibacteria bacterium]